MARLALTIFLVTDSKYHKWNWFLRFDLRPVRTPALFDATTRPDLVIEYPDNRIRCQQFQAAFNSAVVRQHNLRRQNTRRI